MPTRIGWHLVRTGLSVLGMSAASEPPTFTSTGTSAPATSRRPGRRRADIRSYSRKTRYRSLIAYRLQQIRKHGPVVFDDEGFDGHSGQQGQGPAVRSGASSGSGGSVAAPHGASDEQARGIWMWSVDAEGNHYTVATGTLPSFQYSEVNGINGDVAAQFGDHIEVIVHGSPNPPEAPLGPFGEFVSGFNQIAFNGSDAVDVFDGSYMEANIDIFGGGGNDTFYGAFRHLNQINGDGGEDPIIGQGVNDVLDGGADYDYIADGDNQGDATIQGGLAANRI